MLMFFKGQKTRENFFYVFPTGCTNTNNRTDQARDTTKIIDSIWLKGNKLNLMKRFFKHNNVSSFLINVYVQYYLFCGEMHYHYPRGICDAMLWSGGGGGGWN
jgi:hypothetical protein